MIAIIDKQIFPLQNKSIVLVTLIYFQLYHAFYHILYYLFTCLMPLEYHSFWDFDPVTSLSLICFLIGEINKLN